MEREEGAGEKGGGGGVEGESGGGDGFALDSGGGADEEEVGVGV